MPKCGGLWPHFVRHGEIAPGTEWSSVDTIIALIALLEAREALGLDTTKVEEQLIQIKWAKLLSADNYLSHGYAFECDEHWIVPGETSELRHGWPILDMPRRPESWLP